jgi:hypothetical protein
MTMRRRQFTLSGNSKANRTTKSHRGFSLDTTELRPGVAGSGPEGATNQPGATPQDDGFPTHHTSR